MQTLSGFATGAELLRYTPDLSTVSTADLQAELSRREGVVTFVLDDEDSDFFYEYHDGGRVTEGAVTGPVTITFRRD